MLIPIEFVFTMFCAAYYPRLTMIVLFFASSVMSMYVATTNLVFGLIFAPWTALAVVCQGYCTQGGEWTAGWKWLVSIALICDIAQWCIWIFKLIVKLDKKKPNLFNG